MHACLELGAFDAGRFLRAWAETLTRADARPTHWHVLAWAQRPPVDFSAAFAQASGPPLDQADALLLASLSDALRQAAWGLLPGVHRLRLQVPSHPQVHTLLNLCIGEAAAALARSSAAPSPFMPSSAKVPDRGARVVVVGAGLAGAACAHALAERGYTVHVLDQGATPAAGASGLPVGLVAPHASPDDSVMSRLSRAGMRAMRDAMTRLLELDRDWGDSGVQERRLPGKTRKGGAPAHWATDWPSESAVWTRAATGEAVPANTLWHARGAWVRPAALVRALLKHPHIHWQAQAHVTHLQRSDAGATHAWQVMHHDRVVAHADQVILATGPATPELLQASGLSAQATPIRPLRGQLSWGLMSSLGDAPALPASPVNGHGCFVHSLTTEEGPAWFAGATFDRERHTPVWLAQDQAENLARAQALLPELAPSLAQAFASGQVRDWVGVRCSVPDRLPMVGAVPHTSDHTSKLSPDGLWLCSALGSRGLTLSVLCGELLAGQWTGEPLPLEPALARALSSQRFVKP